MALLSPLWRKYKGALSTIAIAATLLTASAIWGNRGLLQLIKLQRELRDLEATASQVQQTNEQLRAHLRRLRSDRTYQERVVREHLGWVKEGELLYRLPRASARSGSRPPAHTAARADAPE